MSGKRLWLLAAVIISMPALSGIRDRAGINLDDAIEYVPSEKNRCGGELNDVERMLETNDFDLFRSLLQYKEHLGPEFWTVLQALKSRHVWFDSGTGAFVALAEFLTRTKWAPNDPRPLPDISWWRRPRVVGLVYRMPPEAERFLRAIDEAGQRHRLQIIQNHKLETVDPRLIGRCNLITDVMGPFSYTERLDLVINKYLSLVPVGGHIFILTSTLRTRVTTAEGDRYLSHYLAKALKGHKFGANEGRAAPRAALY